LLEVRAAGLHHPYRWLRRPDDLDALASSLHQCTLEREIREIARLDQVLTLAAHDGCQAAFLAAHFGEQLPHPCGHCSWCENGGREALPAGPRPLGRSEPAPREGPASGDLGPGLPASPRSLLDRPQNPTPSSAPSPTFPSRRCCGGWKRERGVASPALCLSPVVLERGGAPARLGASGISPGREARGPRDFPRS
jgi:hypothetical protein